MIPWLLLLALLLYVALVVASVWVPLAGPLSMAR